MKWTSHAAIARAVSHELSLTRSMEEALREGSIDPDRRPDYARGRRVPHHRAPDWIIVRHCWSARLRLLDGDAAGAAFDLGRALHYVQDRSVDYHTKWGHDRLEEAIADLVPPMEAVASGVDGAESSPRYVESAARSVRPRRRAQEAMRSACLASAGISAAVLGPLDPEDPLIERVERERGRRAKRPMALLASSSIAVASVLAAAALRDWGPLLGLAPASLAWPLVAGIPDRGLEKEAAWFGIRI